MSTAIVEPETGGEEFLLPPRISWDRYLTISEAVGETRSVRIRYRDGRMSFLSPSRFHDWTGRRLADLIRAVASACGIEWEDAGSATLRRSDLKVGVEPDQSFHLGAKALSMIGGRNIDLDTDPPPDLAVEIEPTRSVDDSMPSHAAIGVSEIRRLNTSRGTFAFWCLEADGVHVPRSESRLLPGLTAADVVAQWKSAEELGSRVWTDRLPTFAEEIRRRRLS